MKKRFTLLLLAAGITAQAQQLSPQGEIYLQKAEGQAGRPEGYVYRQDASGAFYLPAMILTDGTVKASTLQQKGIRVHTQAGAIWTIEFPQATFPQLSRNLPGVRYIELDVPLAPTMDSARKVTRVDSVHAGYNLPKGYSGTGVVMGILDVGFEYSHPAFFDTTYNRYRVRRVWEQKASSGTPPTGYSYGREYTDTTLIKAAGSDNETATHGMHVAGIATGSGVGAGDTTNRRYRGMAYNADVVLVGITPAQNAWTSTSMSDIIDGMNYVYSYAATVRKPAVVNLSWGCPVGPHDGASLFSQACDALTGKGKLFVLSGGNNGDEAIHLQKTMTSTDTLIKSYFSFPTTPIGRKSWIDIWGESGQNVQVQLYLYNGLTPVDSTGWIPVGSGTRAVTLRGSTTPADTLGGYVSASVAAFNNKPRILLDLQSATNKRLLISIKGSTGTINAWAGYVYQSTGYYGSFNGGIGGAVGGNTNLTVSDMVTTRSALAVAAYVSKNIYTNVSGVNVSYSTVATGGIAPFSSKGPTADGRIKPDIAGPGMVVTAPISGLDTSYDVGRTGRSSVVTEWTAPNGRTYRYGALMGTSMSSPAVAGIVAMLLEADSSLTPARVKEILQETAITDAGTGGIPTGGSPIWGAGKVNAYAALQKALATLGIAEVTQNPARLDVLLYPNPATGQSTLEYSGARNETARLQLTDLSGRRLRQQDWAIHPGANTIAIDWTGLPSGLYFVQLQTTSGTAQIKVFRK
jgi:hypothetical protein